MTARQAAVAVTTGAVLAGVLGSGAADPGAQGASLPLVRHRVAVIAHRGGAALAPENTLAAIRNAIRLGADYVELDVRTSQDGHLVLMHDATTNRTTDGGGAVKDLTLPQLRTLDAGRKFGRPGEAVPTLEEALRECRGKIHVYLDHKEAAVPDVLAAVSRGRMLAQVVVYAGVETLQEWKRRAPHIPVMPSLPREYRVPGGIPRFLTILPAEVLDGNQREWTPTLVREAHAAGVKVYVDALGENDQPAGFRRALELGVDGIQTDHPDQLLAVLQERE